MLAGDPNLLNVIDGGAGADLMIGGVRNDVFYVDNNLDSVIDSDGFDTVRTTVSGTLATGLERLDLLGTRNIDGTGNAADNVIVGNAGSNRIDGGGGTDTVSYITARTGVVVGLDRLGPQATGAGVDTLISIESLFGSPFNDTIHGSVGPNVLTASLGIDTVSYARAPSAVVVNLSILVAQDTGGGGLDTLANFENIVGTAFKDTLAGNFQANRIDGGADNDTMTGGVGDDSYVVDSALDVVVEAASGGIDTVLASVSIAALAAQVENVTLTGTAAVNATGNTLNNLLVGNTAANLLNGGTGSDTVSYAATASGVNVNLATGLATGGAGGDSLVSIENVVGSAFADAIVGSALANTITGGKGSDALSGGPGADTFVLDNLAGPDSVLDFASGSDRIRISQAGIRVGDGDLLVEGAVTVNGPSGFAPTAELVIVTANAPSLTTSGAALAIGAASSGYAVGAKAIFVVDDGTDTAVFRFLSSSTNATVSAGELRLVALIDNTTTIVPSDFLFGP